MFLPLVQAIIMVMLAALSYLTSRINQPQPDWLNVAHAVSLLITLAVLVLVLCVISWGFSPDGVAAVCKILMTCVTVTPTP